MPNNSNSKCQLFQLHIDAYLDDELESARAEELKLHLGNCEACSNELVYAEQLHRAVVDLPILDCSDQALEPVDRLFANAGSVSAKPTEATAGQRFITFITSLPQLVRYGVPATAVLLLAIGLGRSYFVQQPGADLATAQAEYSQAEIVQALQDLEVAIDYLGKISQRTNVMIEDRFLLQKLEESISAAYRSDGTDVSTDDVSAGPF